MYSVNTNTVAITRRQHGIATHIHVFIVVRRTGVVPKEIAPEIAPCALLSVGGKVSYHQCFVVKFGHYDEHIIIVAVHLAPNIAGSLFYLIFGGGVPVFGISVAVFFDTHVFQRVGMGVNQFSIGKYSQTKMSQKR